MLICHVHRFMLFDKHSKSNPYRNKTSVKYQLTTSHLTVSTCQISKIFDKHTNIFSMCVSLVIIFWLMFSSMIYIRWNNYQGWKVLRRVAIKYSNISTKNQNYTFSAKTTLRSHLIIYVNKDVNIFWIIAGWWHSGDVICYLVHIICLFCFDSIVWFPGWYIMYYNICVCM